MASEHQSSDDILDILNEEDDGEKEEKVKEKEEVEDEDEIEIEDEDKDEDEEELKKEGKEKKEEGEEEELDDEKLNLVVPVRKSEIKKKYPTFFKEFPSVEVSIYRDRQFVEIFPTIDDAKEASEKAEQLDKFESSLMQGNTEEIFKLIKENDPEAFTKIADNYLNTLAKVDEKAYLHTISNVVKHTIISMVREAKAIDGRARTEEDKKKAKALIDHAEAINEFVFGTSEFSNPTRLTPEEKPDDDGVKRERQEIATERFENALGDLQSRVDNTIQSTIDINIDPKGSMSSFVKKHASREAFDKIEELVVSDRGFKKTLDSLWRAAVESKYSRASLERIRSAYLSKAKTLLPGAIKAARIEALKGIGRSKNDNDDDKDRRGHLPVGRTSSSDNRGGKKLSVPEGMSNKDFLMSD